MGTDLQPRWFEFVLEPDKINHYLEDNPTKLINYLLPILASDNEENEVVIPANSYEAQYRLKKTRALQILSLKVASYLKWDLNVISDNLTIPLQYKLMQSLRDSCSSEFRCPLGIERYSKILFRQWFLRTAITYQLSILQPQSSNTTIIYLSPLQQQQQASESNAMASIGELFLPSSNLLKMFADTLCSDMEEILKTSERTEKRMKTAHPFDKVKLSRPTIGCFDLSNDRGNKWSCCEPVSPKEFLDSVCYDMGRFFFFDESYGRAKQFLEIIRDSGTKFPLLQEYLDTAEKVLRLQGTETASTKETGGDQQKFVHGFVADQREETEKYLFDCMREFSRSHDSRKQKKEIEFLARQSAYRDVDLRINPNKITSWYLHDSTPLNQQKLMEAEGDRYKVEGKYKEATGSYVGALMIMTDYFRSFSKNYTLEEQNITNLIQCSIALSCFTQAVALCQMTKNMNYTIAFKQLNERLCNDCCDDIHECIWNVTLLEYIINLHSRRGEVERRTKVIQLIGQLELNENNNEEILREAEHVRRSRFFRMMANKYL